MIDRATKLKEVAHKVIDEYKSQSTTHLLTTLEREVKQMEIMANQMKGFVNSNTTIRTHEVDELEKRLVQSETRVNEEIDFINEAFAVKEATKSTNELIAFGKKLIEDGLVVLNMHDTNHHDDDDDDGDDDDDYGDDDDGDDDDDYGDDDDDDDYGDDDDDDDGDDDDHHFGYYDIHALRYEIRLIRRLIRRLEKHLIDSHDNANNRYVIKDEVTLIKHEFTIRVLMERIENESNNYNHHRH